MNLLVETTKIYKKLWKNAMLQEISLEQNGLTWNDMGCKDFNEYIDKQWNNQLKTIEEKIAPKYHELKETLIRAKIMKSNDDKLKDKWALITLRPEPDSCSLGNFIIDIHKLCKKKLILQCKYAFEQTGTDDNTKGKGFHCHILAKLRNNTNVQHIIAACNFIKYNCIIQVGNKSGRKFIPNKTELEWCENYINGDKHNDSKTQATIIDKIWRKENNIEDLYKADNQDPASA